MLHSLQHPGSNLLSVSHITLAAIARHRRSQMARKPNDDRLQTIAQTIRDNPNRKPGWIARVLGLDNKSMMRALAQLEDQGVLLAEDDRGRVSVIDQRR